MVVSRWGAPAVLAAEAPDPAEAAGEPMEKPRIIAAGDAEPEFHDPADARAADDAGYGLVGATPAMRQLRHEIARAGPTAASVLIHGETGTGKELVARALHDASGRAGRFVAVNCGALPEQLLASQLFGHERGSFTGAERRHPGFLEQAAGGTLFLDEIGEMPKPLQVYLLRVLETRRYTRLGGTEELPVDARIVAATHRDPRAVGSVLREDLFYRLNEYPVRVPPLRERRADIPLLVRAFAAEINREHGTCRALDEEWAGSLRDLPWRGNVRELRAHVRYAYLRSGQGPIRVDPLEQAPAAHEAYVAIPAHATLREAEDILIDAALARAGYSKVAAARALGITARTIQNRLAKRRARPGP